MVCSTKEKRNKTVDIHSHVQIAALYRQLALMDKLTCETCCDSPAVDGAVAGAGLVDHLIKRQLLGIGR